MEEVTREIVISYKGYHKMYENSKNFNCKMSNPLPYDGELKTKITGNPESVDRLLDAQIEWVQSFGRRS